MLVLNIKFTLAVWLRRMAMSVSVRFQNENEISRTQRRKMMKKNSSYSIFVLCIVCFTCYSFNFRRMVWVLKSWWLCNSQCRRREYLNRVFTLYANVDGEYDCFPQCSHVIDNFNGSKDGRHQLSVVEMTAALQSWVFPVSSCAVRTASWL